MAAYATFRQTDKADEKLVFADRTMLSGLWDSYKREYWEEETGRTLDKQQNDITTSEGQSYTMLRAVWQSDKQTFDKSWEWTQEQLKREDNLFSWRWGMKADGTYGVLTDAGGQNSASDGDADIALALIMAASRWQQDSYLQDAKTIVGAIWEEEVIDVNGKPYLASNNLEKASTSPAVMNPSYFAPYAYRIFAKVDPDNDWMKVVDSSYELINQTLDSKLDKSQSAGLPPDWILLNKETGVLTPPTGGQTTNFSYDAMRTPWRLALDYSWNKDERARETLGKMKFLGDEWKRSGKLVATYSHDGQALTGDESAEVYGTAIGYFKVVDPDEAKKIYDTKLVSLYDANNNTWSQPVNYYTDNWVWFGMALYDDQLPNLAEEKE